VLFTSGSEGAPKGVALSHRNLITNCAQLSSVIDFHGGDIVFNAMPMFHSFGGSGAPPTCKWLKSRSVALSSSLMPLVNSGSFSR